MTDQQQGNALRAIPTLQPGDVTSELRLPGAGLGAGIALAVLSSDDALIDTVELVVSSDHAISICQNEAELADLILMSSCGVALIDAASVPSDLPALTSRLREQFPDLVLVVAGGAEHQAVLGAQIASSEVYRFLHKPVSEQRVRLFVDAALRRHDEEHALLRLEQEQKQKAVAAVAKASSPRGRASAMPRGLGLVAIALTVVGAIGAWFALREKTTPAAPATAASSASATTPASAGTDARTSAPTAPVANARPPDGATLALLDAADRALASNELVRADGRGAGALYAQVLVRHPSEARAITGLETVVTALLTSTEKLIAEEKLDEAARTLEAARALRPENVRVAFLQGQLGKERERAQLVKARAAATSGEAERQQLDAKLKEILDRAEQRIASGALVEPAGDNARFLIENARALVPRDPRIDRVQDRMRDRALNETRAALARNDDTASSRWLRMAADVGVPAETLDALRAQLASAKTNARSAEVGRLSALVSQRIADNRLLEPAGDSALGYYAQLKDADGGGVTVASLRQPLSRALLSEARAAAANGDMQRAQRALGEAETLGGAGAADLAAARAELATARARAEQRTAVVGANSLKRTRFVEPAYPRAARAAGLEGWVDVEFTVATSGEVRDITVTGAEPAKTFDAAAIDAISKWRFEPVRRDGAAIEQRARLRLRFKAD